MQPNSEKYRLLLRFLSASTPISSIEYGSWFVQPIVGGANNLLYRVTSFEEDLAVKFTIRDSRRRAEREHAALTVMQATGQSIAPTPVLLDCDSYPQPVVVQSWLDGEVKDEPPTSDAEWCKLLTHYAHVHAIQPHHKAFSFDAMPFDAVLTARSLSECRYIVNDQIQRVPFDERPQELRELIEQFNQCLLGEWPTPIQSLCHTDPNITNFVRQPAEWLSVDWENSGWGDPAFEIADTMAHPAYLDVDLSRWRWVVDTYCELVDDQSMAERIWVYYQTMLVWWVARFARSLYEIPKGFDQRLVERPPDWEEKCRAKYSHYLALAYFYLEDQQ
ncbi:aminoglycoside phosphotransferase family protein [Chloroflexi bacterium TSY]|nr:aminoglycoside phosphotransferase family protein [Chloroflexi bacterium TSY]